MPKRDAGIPSCRRPPRSSSAWRQPKALPAGLRVVEIVKPGMRNAALTWTFPIRSRGAVASAAAPAPSAVSAAATASAVSAVATAAPVAAPAAASAAAYYIAFSTDILCPERMSPADPFHLLIVPQRGPGAGYHSRFILIPPPLSCGPPPIPYTNTPYYYLLSPTPFHGGLLSDLLF